MMRADVLTGDCVGILTTLPEGEFGCCVTSPPYWGLRDYGTAIWDGGDPACGHKHETKHQAQGATSARVGRSNVEAQRNENFRGVCGSCGATRLDQQIGQEATPDEYVASLVAVFRGVRRVLRREGTLWLNLGDSYAVGGGGGQSGSSTLRGNGHGGEKPLSRQLQALNGHHVTRRMPDGLKPKDLVGIPWRVAFALQADGWYLRSDIIWHKPNPMPESVTDRPTKAHEYVFLLTKSAKYWYDAAAIAEPSTYADCGRPSAEKGAFQPKGEPLPGQLPFRAITETRNARSVWTIATQPYAGAHFATFPPELARRCVRAGCPTGGAVLDPFAGSGTTGAVAVEEGRSFTGIELNPEYVKLAEKRIRAAQPPLFAEIGATHE